MKERRIRRNAAQTGPGWRRRLVSWLVRHLQVFFYTLGQLSRGPANTLLTTSVIGIALALPAGLYVLVDNAQAVSRGWDGTAQISVFLKQDVDDAAGTKAAGELGHMPEVESVRYISKTEALQEYERMSGFPQALKALESNPLPGVIVVQPRPAFAQPAAVQALVDRLSKRSDVDFAQFDLQWVKRFYAIMQIVQRGVLVLAGLLSVAVLLIVGNTIRLGIQNRRDEIEIAKLFGATNAFIRRPFLYTGLWYGIIGSVIAWLLVSLAFELLRGPARHLADLYYSDFLLHGLDPTASAILVACGTVLGLLGSWLAVGQHLGDIEPS